MVRRKGLRPLRGLALAIETYGLRIAEDQLAAPVAQVGERRALRDRRLEALERLPGAVAADANVAAGRIQQREAARAVPQLRAGESCEPQQPRRRERAF